METPLTDSMPDFSVLQSSPSAEDDPASPAGNSVAGVKELLTVPGQEGSGGGDREGDEMTSNPFFSRSQSFRGGSRDLIK